MSTPLCNADGMIGLFLMLLTSSKVDPEMGVDLDMDCTDMLISISKEY